MSHTAAESAPHRAHFAILGAGPTGLEAALAAAEHGYGFSLYEASPEVAGHVRGWGHVRLFTPWSMNASPRMRAALAAAGRSLPEDGCPTGDELVEHLFEPLAALPQLAGNLRLGSRVLSVGRRGLLKHEEISSSARAGRPFRLLVADSEGRERTELADIVLDCTGNTVPNALGDAGIPAPGERAFEGRIRRDVPDLRKEGDGWAGKTTLLVGGGHSAQTALRDLMDLAANHPGTRVIWVLRGALPHYEESDVLPERRQLTEGVHRAAAERPDVLDVRQGRAVETLSASPTDRLEVTLRAGDGALETVEVDRILSLTGRVGDHLLYRQLQVHECYATSGPMKLAAALLSSSGGGGDCLAQTSLGPETLRSPEPGFFILGSKSYGRRNDFLLRVGWEQVDEIFQLVD
ncbi:MAG: hypothetical protein AAGN66_01725 [Acidobacteriota bacterium]